MASGGGLSRVAALCIVSTVAGCGRLGYAPGLPRDGGLGDGPDGLDGQSHADGAPDPRDGGAPHPDAGPGQPDAGDAGDAGDAAVVDGGPSSFSGPCADVLAADPAAGDGSYTVDPDGAGPLGPLQVSCDMTTDGGGWTLVLGYLHRAGTMPVVHVRTDTLPQLGSSSLGADESGTSTWGHAAPSLLGQLAFSELRFHCVTSAHPRVLDFATRDETCIAYVRSGTGGCMRLRGSFRPLPGHTAHLPAESTHLYTGMGDQAMTYLPFYKSGTPKYEWLITPPEWECDDSVGATADTLHRIWIR